MGLPDYLLDIRAKLDISQEELANLLHVSFVTISRWENGKSRPTKKTMKMIENLCKEKNITVDKEGL